jgi:hypothetical protein
VRDGRLTGADRASFERHAKTCATCAREVRVLEILDTALERVPTHPTPLDLRRRRSNLLRRANDLVVGVPKRSWLALPYAAAIAAISLVVAIVWVVRLPSFPQPAAPAIATASMTPTYRLSASPRASWRMLEEATSVRIELREGRFDFDVDTLVSGQRFLLTLPDGELEVKGTRFVADVADGRTRSVSVQEGRVALRIAGREQVILLGGDIWPPSYAATDATVKEGPALPSATALPSVSGKRRAPSAVASRTEAPGSSAPASEPSADAARTPNAQSEFTLAMSAFSAGDFARAEALFLTFELHHPRDGRVEDSTFLRAVARSRRGDATGAQALAREYLQRYPRGLRRIEAERLAGNR